jgi:DNA-binding beta-propeller fold protein YncE
MKVNYTMFPDLQLFSKMEKEPLCRRWCSFLAFFFCFFSSLCILIFSAHRAEAQLVGSYIDHENNLTSDADGKNILLPQFIFAEPVMEEVYLIDGKSRIMIYTSDLFPLHTLDKRHGIDAPLGLTMDEDGTLYVALSRTKSNPRHRIAVFSACLKWDRDIYIEGFEGADEFSPFRLAIDRTGNIYVTAEYYPGVLVLDNDGQLLDILSPEEGGSKVFVTNVSIDKNGRIYVVSEEAGHVYVYDENRQFLFQFGEKGGSSGKLSRPRAVGIDNKTGNIYVADYMRHSINTYDKEGNYLFEFGGRGWGSGWFQFPNDLAIDSQGRIWVADMFNNRVQVLRPRVVSKKPTEIDIVRVGKQNLSTEHYSYDTPHGYSLQQRLKIVQHNQTVRLPLP